MSEHVGGSLLIWCSEDADLALLTEAFAQQRWTLVPVSSIEDVLAHQEHDTPPLCIVICDDPGRTRLEQMTQHASLELPVIAAVRQGDVPRSVLAMQTGAVTVVEMPPGEHTPRVSSLMQAIDEHVRPASDWRPVDPRDAIIRAPDSPLLGMLEDKKNKKY